MTPEVGVSVPLEVVQKGILPNGKPRFGFAKTESPPMPVSIKGFHLHGKVNTQDSPYTIELNEARFVELLQNEFGFPREVIEKIEVHVIGEGKKMEEYSKEERKNLFPYGSPIKNYFEKKFLRQQDLWAVANPEGDTVFLVIYGNLIWRILSGDRKRIIEYLRRRVKIPEDLIAPDRLRALDQETREVRVTRKRIRSLSRIPSRLDTIIRAIANRDIRESVIHESDHIDEDVKNPNSFWNEEWRGRLLYILATFFPPINDFLEGRAERREKELGKKHQYFDLVTFRINDTQVSGFQAKEPPRAA